MAAREKVVTARRSGRCSNGGKGRVKGRSLDSGVEDGDETTRADRFGNDEDVR